MMAEAYSARCLPGNNPLSASRATSHTSSYLLCNTVWDKCILRHRLSQRISADLPSTAPISRKLIVSHSRSYRWSDDEIEGLTTGLDGRFQEAVDFFNAGDYYACHDVLEAMWHQAAEPQRSLLHALLQCSVALHHLLNQNHRGAMLELGEGMAKLRRCTAVGAPAGREDSIREGDSWVSSNPFVRFAEQAAALQEFVYHTQMEQAACSDDVCATLDGSPSSYRLLDDSFAAGRPLYRRGSDPLGAPTVEFCRAAPQQAGGGEGEVEVMSCGVSMVAVKIPVLEASEEDLMSLQW